MIIYTFLACGLSSTRLATWDSAVQEGNRIWVRSAVGGLIMSGGGGHANVEGWAGTTGG